jgi:putative endonuclease
MNSSYLHRKQLGAKAEERVATYLAKQGFLIVARQYRTSQGEVDIIGMQGDLLVFVEVKARSNVAFPLSSVITPAKQRRIAKTAALFMLNHRLSQTSYSQRFDVALLDEQQPDQLTYIPNALTSWP